MSWSEHRKNEGERDDLWEDMGNGRLVMFSDSVYTIFMCWLQIRATANFFANSYNQINK